MGSWRGCCGEALSWSSSTARSRARPESARVARKAAGGAHSAMGWFSLGGAVGSVLGGALAERGDRVTVCRWSSLVFVEAVAGVVFVPGPALYACVALTSAGLYVPFSLQVTLGQDYLPSGVGTAGGTTLGPAVGVGGLASPLIGRLADATSLRTALAPLVLMPALSRLLLRTLPEPASPWNTTGNADETRPPPSAPTPVTRGDRADRVRRWKGGEPAE